MSFASRMPRWTGLAFCLLAVAALAGCKNLNEEPWSPRARPAEEPTKDYGRALPPGQLALRKIPPEMYPDFSRGYADQRGLERAIRYSIEYLRRPSSQRYFPYGDISHARALASLQTFLDVLHEARSGADLDRIIRERFDVYQSVGCDDQGTVFFTGYYTPIFEGRRQREGAFQYPLYSYPPDLEKDSEGMILGRRSPDGRLVPYFTRREIEQRGLLRGREVAWLKDPFEAYVVSVQGSAKLKLADGSLYELGYAGNNGHSYTPVSAKMIEDGVLSRDQLSLQALMQYFHQHPQDIPKYTWQNDRFIFFKESRGGPFGSINVPVTTYRSLATDKSVFPRACLAFVDTNLPEIQSGSVMVRPYAGFACDQDTGGAIRAAGRSDVYFGIGGGAEALAGRTGAEGMLYYIFVKDAAETPQ